MLDGSETWPVRKENVVALQRAEMRMVRWMCGVKLKDRLPSKELRERLGVALVLQQNRLRWYGHVLRKDDGDWVKKCMEYEVEGSRPSGRPKKTWKEVVHKYIFQIIINTDCQHNTGLNLSVLISHYLEQSMNNLQSYKRQINNRRSSEIPVEMALCRTLV